MILDRTKLVNRAIAQKKIKLDSKVDANTFPGFKVICDFIDVINDQDEDVFELFDGRHIDDLVIPSEFKDFINPKSVRLVPGDRKFKDLLPDKKNQKPQFSYTDLIDAYDQFRGVFKKDGHSDMVQIGSLRTDKSLIEVIDKIAVGSKCKCDGHINLPIVVKGIDGLILDRYLDQDVVDVCDDYLWSLKF